MKLLTSKIDKLEAEIREESRLIREDALKIETKFRNILERKFTSIAAEVSIDDERNEIKEFISDLKLIKCYEKMDKLEWFKLMRMRA